MAMVPDFSTQKIYFRAGLISLYGGIYIHRPISKTKQAKKVKTHSNEHRILKGTNCRNVVLVVQREKSFPQRKSAPGVSDHQRNGDDEEADHHEMDVKSYDHEEDDSA